MAVGSATILGSFAARLGIDTGEYAKGIIQAQAMNSVFGQTFTNFITNPLLGSIDLFKKAAGGAMKLGVDVLGSAEAVQRLSQQTGASTEMLQALAMRMEVAGFQAGSAGDSLLFLGKQLNEARNKGGPAADTFARLGIDISRLASTDDALAAVLEALNGIADPATRSAVAMELLGRRGGPDLVNAVGGGAAALREMVVEGEKMGSVLGTDAVNSLADFNTTLGYTGLALENVKRNLVAQFLVGFISEFGAGVDGALDLADALNNELGPSMRKFGSDAGEAAGDIRQITEAILDLINAHKDWKHEAGMGIDAVKEYWDNGGAFGPGVYAAKKMLDDVDAQAFNFSVGMR